MLPWMPARIRAACAALCLVVAACQAGETQRPAAPTPSPAHAASGAASSAPTPPVPTPTSPPSPATASAPPSTATAEPSPTAVPSPAASPTPGGSATPFDPASVTLEAVPFGGGLASPVFATGRRDGSGGLLVVEQAGTIRVVAADGSVQADPFLDISKRVLAGG
ncbi:MAG: hypothetical protein QOH61_2481, partial [Chloroflexota bacterium]|nr:hypothetical protein [Chloroflexota bacterium]